VTALLRDIDESQAGLVVPSTPDWTIKDVVAHLSGLVADWLNDNVENYGADEWTAKQVDDRRGRSLAEVLEEWNVTAPKYEAMMDDPEAAGLFVEIPFISVADLAIHEHDLRGALGRPGARDSVAVQIGMKTYVTGLRRRHEAAGLGPLSIRETDGREWPVGTGDPVASVSAPRFDLFRAMAGRRSRAQVLAFDWVGDPEPYVDLFLIGPTFSWAAVDLDH
jgi:uncharacterized protein (TIGR03083 family)